MSRWLRIDNGGGAVRLFNLGAVQSVKWDPAGPNHLTITFGRAIDDINRPDPNQKILGWVLKALSSDVLDITSDP